MIDIHSHLLPGVDDGSPSLDVSIPVLERFVRDGVRVLVCTPHLDASRAAKAPVEHHREIFAELQRRAPEGLELRLGWEIMLDAPGVDLRAPELGLGPSRARLVEFRRGGVPPGATLELRRLTRSGITPVLAHPERYYGVTAEQVREWRSLGVVIQTDGTMLMASGAPGMLAQQMLEEGLIDCIASDNHGDHRSLAAARDWLIEMGAAEHAELLTSRNAGLILNDEEPEVVPPVRIPKGMFRRLRELMHRRLRI